MRTKTVSKLLILVFLVLVSLGVYSQLNPAEITNQPVVAQEREDGVEFGNPKPVKPYELEYYVNLERDKQALKPYVTDERLNESARLKLAQLVREGWGADPHGEKSGKRGNDYISDVGIYCSTRGENLSQTGYGSKNVVFGWMKSTSGHKEALLSPEYDLVGYAVSDDYVVQHFCNID